MEPGVPNAQAINNSAIYAQGVSKQFNGDFAVQGLTIQIPRGIIFGFIGPSGSGKTTTIRLLTGIYTPSEGVVYVLGRDPKHSNAKLRERIGYMPQLFVLYPDLTVVENLNFAASLYGLSIFHRGRLINSLLDFVELDKDRHKLARQISGGMQRRLSLAATLIHNPELIFLDEPTAGIDPILRKKFWDHFRQLQASGRTLFVTTQYVGEAAYCDYVGVLANGKLLMVDTPVGLRHRAYGGEVVDLQTREQIPYDKVFSLQSLPFITNRIRIIGDRALRITVDQANTAIPDIMNWCTQNGLTVDSINEYLPPFDDVFVQVVQAEAAHG